MDIRLKILDFLNHINAKNKEQYTTLKASELFFNVEHHIFEKATKAFEAHYKDAKTILQTICGNPLVEDISGDEYAGFQLSKTEEIGYQLSCYQYKEFRITIMLHQEDKELPIEILLVAVSTASKLKKKKPTTKTENYIEFLGQKKYLNPKHFKEFPVEIDENDVSLNVMIPFKEFDLMFSSYSKWYHPFKMNAIEEIIKNVFKNIGLLEIYPSDKAYEFSDKNVEAFLKENEKPKKQFEEKFENWVNHKFKEKHKEQTFKLIEIEHCKVESIVKKKRKKTYKGIKTTYKITLVLKATIATESDKKHTLLLNTELRVKYESNSEKKEVPVIEKIIDEKAHDLTFKIKAIKSWLQEGNAIPEVFSNGNPTIFQFLNSIDIIGEALTEKDKIYMDLILDNISKNQLHIIDKEHGYTPLLYAYATGLLPFAEYLETKGAQLPNKITKVGNDFLMNMYRFPSHVYYKHEKIVEKVIPFIHKESIVLNVQLLLSKLVRGNIYGNAYTIFKLLIEKGIDPNTPLENGFTCYVSALFQGEKKWISYCEKHLTEEKDINQKDNEGNSILHFFANQAELNFNIPNGIENLRYIVNHPALKSDILNPKLQTALHLVAQHTITTREEKEWKLREVDFYTKAFDLVLQKVTNVNQQDYLGNTILHYLAGYQFIKFDNEPFKIKSFDKTHEKNWRIKAVELVLTRNIDSSILNDKGQTALDIAMHCKMNPIIKILKQ